MNTYTKIIIETKWRDQDSPSRVEITNPRSDLDIYDIVNTFRSALIAHGFGEKTVNDVLGERE
jgi:hypothetical protein